MGRAPIIDRYRIEHAKPPDLRSLASEDFGTTRRSDGSLQVTYNKHPLYTFALDKQAGQTTGEGNLAFGARWYVVSAGGNAVIKAIAHATTSTGIATTNPYP